MSGIAAMVTWVRSAHGDTAVTSTTIVVFTERHVSHACKKIQCRSRRRAVGNPFYHDGFGFDFKLTLSISASCVAKRDPFGLMMRWIMTAKDHATGFVYICALLTFRALVE